LTSTPSSCAQERRTEEEGEEGEEGREGGREEGEGSFCCRGCTRYMTPSKEQEAIWVRVRVARERGREGGEGRVTKQTPI
jgi:hypothetical protein